MMLLSENISVLHQTEEVVIQSLKYRPPLLLNWRMNIPSIAMIVGLYIHDYKKITICNKLQTEEFEWKCNAYKVTPTNEHEVCLITKLKNHLPIYCLDDDKFIMNRYCHFGQGYF